MAEIPVERKSGGKTWLWLLVLAVLALLAWMLFSRDEEPEPATVGTAQVTAPTPDLGALATLGAWNVTTAA